MLKLISCNRTGKSESKGMKMLQKHFNVLRTSPTLYSDRSYWIQGSGRVQSQTQMLRRNKKESMHYVLFSSLVELKHVHGQ